jgi:hypothetical protein
MRNVLTRAKKRPILLLVLLSVSSAPLIWLSTTTEASATKLIELAKMVIESGTTEAVCRGDLAPHVLRLADMSDGKIVGWIDTDDPEVVITWCPGFEELESDRVGHLALRIIQY